VLTVNNNPGSVAMFQDFPAAYAAAKDGDTILMAGSDASYFTGSFGITKRLHLVGSGYQLSENGIPGLSSKAVGMNELVFHSLSDPQSATEFTGEGSTLTGISLSTLSTTVGITVDRCRLATVFDTLSNFTNPGRITMRRCLMSPSASVVSD
jgi:hypothetical protein